MNRFVVEYTKIVEYSTWAVDAVTAEAEAAAQPDYHATHSVTDEGAFPFTVGQVVYTFDKDIDAILEGSVTSVDFLNSNTVNTYARMGSEASDRVYSYVEGVVVDLYATKQEVIDYLEREL